MVRSFNRICRLDNDNIIIIMIILIIFNYLNLTRNLIIIFYRKFEVTIEDSHIFHKI